MGSMPGLLLDRRFFSAVDELVGLAALGAESKSSSQDSITYGAGVGAMLGRHINLRLEYERLDPDEFKDADAVWLTAAWRFL